MSTVRADSASGRAPGIAEKRAFLSSGAAWPHEPPPTCIETHASFVFLTLDRAFKLKKPVSMPHADMRELAARRTFCEEEIRLNRELAGDVYRRTVALRVLPDGRLSLGDTGEIVDWLVEMTRLPAAAMLDHRIINGPMPDASEIAEVGTCLIAFYTGRGATPARGPAYYERLTRVLATDIAHLNEMAAWLDTSEVAGLAARVRPWLEAARPEIEKRAAAGFVVEGHGDLRAEHICLLSPPVLFDRLEFDDDFRFIDPHDEISALGLDCLRLGAGWIGPALHRQLSISGIVPPSRGLLTLYRVLRCLTKARLAIDHHRDPHPRTPQKWAPLARWFIATALASQA